MKSAFKGPRTAILMHSKKYILCTEISILKEEIELVHFGIKLALWQQNVYSTVFYVLMEI